MSKATAFWEGTFRREGDAGSRVMFQLATDLSARQVDSRITLRVHIAVSVSISVIRHREIEKEKGNTEKRGMEVETDLTEACCWNLHLLAHDEGSISNKKNCFHTFFSCASRCRNYAQRNSTTPFFLCLPLHPPGLTAPSSSLIPCGVLTIFSSIITGY